MLYFFAACVVCIYFLICRNGKRLAFGPAGARSRNTSCIDNGKLENILSLLSHERGAEHGVAATEHRHLGASVYLFYFFFPFYT